MFLREGIRKPKVVPEVPSFHM